MVTFNLGAACLAGLVGNIAMTVMMQASGAMGMVHGLVVARVFSAVS